MSLELVNTFATLGTFLVIAATAIAAVVQLRHARGSNQIAALTELRDAFQSHEFSDAMGFVETQLGALLDNPEFRYQFANRSARTPEFRNDIDRVRLIGNYFEDMGALMLAGLVDRESLCMIYSSDLTRAWEAMEPALAISRRKTSRALWENFEYAAMVSFRWIQAHPDGAYPAREPRLSVVDRWVESDRQYVATKVAALS
ncbi:MAG TPA: hypothetical protein VFE36_09470 [Candidatus Baltobacteraceae bacterium]|jgi:hypothetical protein|nr:hypothetical protein [Candidatus Baltobacteraceae bacterium]